MADFSRNSCNSEFQKLPLARYAFIGRNFTGSNNDGVWIYHILHSFVKSSAFDMHSALKLGIISFLIFLYLSNTVFKIREISNKYYFDNIHL